MTRRVVKPQRDCFDNLGDGSSLYDFKTSKPIRCPYGEPGDLLWVRETFCESPGGPIYKATEEDDGMLEPDNEIKWTPSIFMPKKHARIWLEIRHIFVERLQTIFPADAIAEGIELNALEDGEIDGDEVIDRFAVLWESINGPGSWKINPWVWAVEFQRI